MTEAGLSFLPKVRILDLLMKEILLKNKAQARVFLLSQKKGLSSSLDLRLLNYNFSINPGASSERESLSETILAKTILKKEFLIKHLFETTNLKNIENVYLIKLLPIPISKCFI